jgi:hypothetical protein
MNCVGTGDFRAVPGQTRFVGPLSPRIPNMSLTAVHGERLQNSRKPMHYSTNPSPRFLRPQRHSQAL